MSSRTTKTYSELIKLPTFEERFQYLRLDGLVGRETFGFDRYLNQQFYSSPEWRHFRREVIIRDEGCDLGIEDRDIGGPITIHHIVPITVDDIVKRSPALFDLNNVICVSERTHRAIHYGDENQLFIMPKERTKNDTCPWKID